MLRIGVAWMKRTSQPKANTSSTLSEKQKRCPEIRVLKRKGSFDLSRGLSAFRVESAHDLLPGDDKPGGR